MRLSPKEYMNILIIKPSSFGDIVQADPTAVVLKRLLPDCRISWLVFDRWAAIVQMFPDVDETIVWRRGGGPLEYLRVIRAVRRKSFDLVIDLQGLLRSALIARLAGAKTIVGVPGMKEASWVFVREAAPAWRSFNAVWRSLETLRHAGITGACTEAGDIRGIDMQDLRTIFRVTVPDAARRQAAGLLSAEGISDTDSIVGIVPSARGRGKQWAPASYTRLIDMIHGERPSVKFVLLDSAASVLRFPAHAGIADLGGMLTLPQLAAVLSRCRVVIGGDTGPMHLAAALGVPVVVLFGGSDVSETAPVSPAATILRKEFPCSPCRGRTPCLTRAARKKQDRRYPCLDAISPAEAAAAVIKWIQ